jgi:hypothetical protein
MVKLGAPSSQVTGPTRLRSYRGAGFWGASDGRQRSEGGFVARVSQLHPRNCHVRRPIRQPLVRLGTATSLYVMYQIAHFPLFPLITSTALRPSCPSDPIYRPGPERAWYEGAWGGRAYVGTTGTYMPSIHPGTPASPGAPLRTVQGWPNPTYLPPSGKHRVGEFSPAITGQGQQQDECHIMYPAMYGKCQVNGRSTARLRQDI